MYTESHAVTTLNALEGTDALNKHDAKVRLNTINECLEFIRNSKTKGHAIYVLEQKRKEIG